MRPSLTQAWWFLNDRLYPRLQPLSQEETERQKALTEAEMAACTQRVAALGENETTLAAYLTECTRLLNDEADVRRGIDGRLTSIVGLSSIAGTIVFGSVLAEAAGKLSAEALPIRLILALGAFYLTLQICCAILASVRGLERRDYSTETLSGILPSPDELQPAYFRRQITGCAERLEDDRRQRKAKVEQMALAHCATKNFVGGLILLALLATCFALTAKNQDEDLIHTLKQDRALYDVLRGPQGPKGEPGPQGPSAKPEPDRKQSSPTSDKR